MSQRAIVRSFNWIRDMHIRNVMYLHVREFYRPTEIFYSHSYAFFRVILYSVWTSFFFVAEKNAPNYRYRRSSKRETIGKCRDREWSLGWCDSGRYGKVDGTCSGELWFMPRILLSCKFYRIDSGEGKERCKGEGRGKGCEARRKYGLTRSSRRQDCDPTMRNRIPGEICRDKAFPVFSFSHIRVIRVNLRS